ncbi:uncharacterized protein ISCGN_001666 [Ixodes scapularis]
MWQYLKNGVLVRSLGQSSHGAESTVFTVHSVLAAVGSCLHSKRVPCGPRLQLTLFSPGPPPPPFLKMAPTPSKAKSFMFSAPSEVPVDQIITALYAIVGEKGLSHFQHHGGSNSLATVNSTEAADKLIAQGNLLLLNNVAAPLEQMDPRIIYESVF